MRHNSETGIKYVGVFFGSRSPEHDISIITAMRVMEGLAHLPSYRRLPIYIAKDGAWYSGEALGDIEFFRHGNYEARLRRYAVSAIAFDGGTMLLYPRRRGLFPRPPARLDIAFPCFHGSYGEDGTIQGLFEMAGIPYVGCGVMASAIAMSKIHTRRAVREAGINTVPTAEISQDIFSRDRPEALRRAVTVAPYPLFVKPNALGSSIGVSRVANQEELESALEVVFHFDRLALVEAAVPNLKEVNVLVIGHRELIVSQPEEPAYRAAFQDFETKYLTKGGTIRQEKSAKTKSVIPARLSLAMASRVQELAQKVFRLLDCSGIMRCEFLLDTVSGELFLGEVNTLPGTLYAHVWEASGIPLPQLIEKLIGYAEERAREERGLQRAFASGVLAQK